MNIFTILLALTLIFTQNVYIIAKPYSPSDRELLDDQFRIPAEKYQYQIPEQFSKRENAPAIPLDQAADPNEIFKRQVGIIYKNSEPIGILQPYRRTYRFIPVKDAEYYESPPQQFSNEDSYQPNMVMVDKRDSGFDYIEGESVPFDFPNLRIGATPNNKKRSIDKVPDGNARYFASDLNDAEVNEDDDYDSVIAKRDAVSNEDSDKKPDLKLSSNPLLKPDASNDQLMSKWKDLGMDDSDMTNDALYNKGLNTDDSISTSDVKINKRAAEPVDSDELPFLR